MCMMVDQWDVVLTNVTHIDRLKGDIFEGPEDHAGVNEVFGIGIEGRKGKRWVECRTDWLSPFTKVCFPQSLENDIMGFCRPSCGSSCGFNASRKKEEKLEAVEESERTIGGTDEIV